MKVLVIILSIVILQKSWGHGGEDHSKKESTQPVVHDSIGPSKENIKEIYEKINTKYKETVKPIFKKSCFDCHSSQTSFPWYYKVPGIKQLIDSDIKEAKTHLDFSNDFPFVSHDTPVKDLNSISKSLSEERMPPNKYLWLHNDKKLTKNEIEEVKNWVNESLEALK